MVQKLKDTFSFVKAKIGGDELDEKLVESVSEENWQTSTHILHEIANAAYNYQKWQRISEFIWDKLKKGKSWRKILKTLNLIQFLLKNGPQSVITNFKYDIYQLRTFQNYSYYSDGHDRGQSIRQRAKVVVNLLNNEQLLEEERVKAKTIREKMSNVLGNGNSYGAGSGGSGSGGYGGGSSGYNNKSYDNYDKGNKYDNYDKKKVSNKDNAYKYGNEGLGVYGDYTYNKSTLDKYKDKASQPTSTNNYSKKEEEKKQPEIVVQTKKPFQQSVSKLAKPGEKKPNQPEPPKVQAPIANQNNNNNAAFIDILDEPKPNNTYQQPTQPTQQTQPQSQPVQQNNNGFDMNFFGTSTNTPVQSNPPPQQQQNNNNLYNQPNNQPNNQQQPVNQQFYPPQQQPQVNPAFKQPVPQPNYPPNQQSGYPQNNYGQMPGYQAPMPGYQQPYMGGYPQPNMPYQQNVAYQGQQYGYQGVPAQQQSPGQYNPYYGQPNQYGGNMGMGYGVNQGAQQPPQIQANVNLNINLSGMNTKQQQQFGNFSSVNSASNVNWLSNKQKGLIDFSDFGAQIKNEQKQSNKNEQINNNIKVDTWSW